MFSIIKKFFFGKKDKLFSIEGEPVLDDAIKFESPDGKIAYKLLEYLQQLPHDHSTFFIEEPLKGKPVTKFSDFQSLSEQIMKDLNNNFIDARKEFEGERIGFTFYLGRHLFFSNSVEVVRKIYHLDNKDIGNIYNSLVVKFHNGKYFYWSW